MHVGVDTQKIEDLFLAVAAVATTVDADGREFATFTPALDGEDGDTEEIGDFTDGEEVGEVT